jgi:hypothetical protein
MYTMKDTDTRYPRKMYETEENYTYNISCKSFFDTCTLELNIYKYLYIYVYIYIYIYIYINIERMMSFEFQVKVAIAKSAYGQIRSRLLVSTTHIIKNYHI